MFGVYGTPVINVLLHFYYQVFRTLEKQGFMGSNISEKMLKFRKMLLKNEIFS